MKSLWRICKEVDLSMTWQRRYEIINESYFCVCHKNRRKHNQHFKTPVFHKKCTLCHIKPNIYICGALRNWHHLYNLKNVKNSYGGVLILVRLQAEVGNFTEINIPPWVLFTFFKLYKWYQMAQCISYRKLNLLLTSSIYFVFLSLEM